MLQLVLYIRLGSGSMPIFQKAKKDKGLPIGGKGSPLSRVVLFVVLFTEF
jgi:hypothetical protein